MNQGRRQSATTILSGRLVRVQCVKIAGQKRCLVGSRLATPTGRRTVNAGSFGVGLPYAISVRRG